MKNLKSTIIVAVLTVIMAIVAYVEYQKSQEDEKREEAQAQVLGWEAETIVNAKLEKDGNVTSLVRTGEEWNIQEPLEDYADEFVADSWVKDIATEKGKVVEAKKDKEGKVLWNEYGLAENTDSIEVENEKGEKALLLFARNNAFDGSYFIRFNDKLILGEKTWGAVLGKSVTSLREKKLFPKWPGVESLTYTRASGKPLAISQKDEKWVFENRSGWKASEVDILAWLKRLQNLRASDFVEEDPTPQQMREWGLNRPEIIVSLVGTDKKIELKLSRQGKDTKTYYAQTSRRPTVYKIPPASAEGLLVHESFFRDGRDPFQFDLTQVTKVKVKEGASEFIIEKSGSEWSLSKPEKGKKLDSEKLEKMFQSLAGIEALIFLGSKSMNPSSKSVELFTSQGESLLSLKFGKEFDSPLVETKNNPLVSVRSSSEKETLGVKASVVTSLGLSDLIVEVKEPIKTAEEKQSEDK